MPISDPGTPENDRSSHDSPHGHTVEEAHAIGQCFLFDSCPICPELDPPTRDEEHEAWADIRWHEDRGC